MHFRPLHDRVVVRRVDAEETTSGGIIIPDAAKEKPQQGEVLAVGAGVRDDQGRFIGLSVGPVTVFCLANGREQKSRSTAKICSS